MQKINQLEVKINLMEKFIMLVIALSILAMIAVYVLPVPVYMRSGFLGLSLFLGFCMSVGLMYERIDFLLQLKAIEIEEENAKIFSRSYHLLKD